MNRQHQLLVIALTSGSGCPLLGFAKGRKEHASQDRDDGNHHQKLNEREPTVRCRTVSEKGVFHGERFQPFIETDLVNRWGKMQRQVFGNPQFRRTNITTSLEFSPGSDGKGFRHQMYQREFEFQLPGR